MSFSRRILRLQLERPPRTNWSPQIGTAASIWVHMAVIWSVVIVVGIGASTMTKGKKRPTMISSLGIGTLLARTSRSPARRGIY